MRPWKPKDNCADAQAPSSGRTTRFFRAVGLFGNPAARRMADVANNRQSWHIAAVDTLDEIERAAEKLPPAKQTELLYFLAQRLADANLPLPVPREFAIEQLKQWMDEDEEEMRRFKARE